MKSKENKIKIEVIGEENGKRGEVRVKKFKGDKMEIED